MSPPKGERRTRNDVKDAPLAEALELRLLVYPVKETQFCEDEFFLMLVENNRYLV